MLENISALINVKDRFICTMFSCGFGKAVNAMMLASYKNACIDLDSSKINGKIVVEVS